MLGVAGQGTFGTVFDAYDHKLKTTVAIKVVRSVKRYYESAEVEVSILEKWRRADPLGKS